jgi:hypothetical protein
MIRVYWVLIVQNVHGGLERRVPPCEAAVLGYIDVAKACGETIVEVFRVRSGT